MLRILPDILKEEEGLGAHSSVLVLSHRFAVEYFWVHKDLRPFGDTLTLQCPKCFAIRTLTFKLLDNKSGEFQASCHCGWTDQKLSGKGDALMLKGSQGSTGWASRLLYGTPAIVDEVWKLPRSTYCT